MTQRTRRARQSATRASLKQAVMYVSAFACTATRLNSIVHTSGSCSLTPSAAVRHNHITGPFTKGVKRARRSSTSTSTSTSMKRSNNNNSNSGAEDERYEVSRLEVGGVTLYGVSVGAVETCVWVPSMSLAFDSGRCPRGVVRMQHMAVTHGHCDHVHGVPLHAASRSLLHYSPPTYFVPPVIASDVRGLLSAVSRLEGLSETEGPAADVQPLSVDDGTYAPLGKGLFLKAVQTQHSVPSQGYVACRRTTKLKPELVGTNIKKLRKERPDVAVQDVVYVPLIAFTGDTTLRAVADSELLRTARILIVEMTFIDDQRSRQQANDMGHVHIDDVIENAHLFERNQFVVFCHFSARYTRAQIAAALQRLPHALRAKSYALGVDTLAPATH